MKNQIIMLKVLNLLLAVLVLNQIVTGLFGDSLPHEAFEVLHQGGGIALAIGVVLHVILNWNWVKVSYFKKKAPPKA